MATVAALGDGPIVYVNELGLQVSVPLSSIQFDGNAIVTTPATPAGSRLDLWLKYLVKQGRLRRSTTAAAPPAPAIVFTAVSQGSQGNHIEVAAREVPGIPAGTPAQVDLTVKASDHYTGLTLANIESVLGTGAPTPTTGSQPGMFRVRTIGPGGAPKDGALVPDTGGLRADDTAATPRASFTVVPRGAGSDVAGATTTAKVTNRGATFDLDIEWTVTVTAVLAAELVDPTLATRLAPFAFVVGVSAPLVAGVPTYKMPAAGKILLSGGADPAKASSALLSK